MKLFYKTTIFTVSMLIAGQFQAAQGDKHISARIIKSTAQSLKLEIRNLIRGQRVENSHIISSLTKFDPANTFANGDLVIIEESKEYVYAFIVDRENNQYVAITDKEQHFLNPSEIGKIKVRFNLNEIIKTDY